jgi:hypothetical protein
VQEVTAVADGVMRERQKLPGNLGKAGAIGGIRRERRIARPDV